MAHLRTVTEHLEAAGAAHRQAHQEALRLAAIARAEAEAAQAAGAAPEGAEGAADGG